MSWQDEALCRDSDLDFFQPRKKGSRRNGFTRAEQYRDDMRRQIAMCGRCPARQACLDHALSTIWTEDDNSGVWGGTIPEERAEMRERRRSA